MRLRPLLFAAIWVATFPAASADPAPAKESTAPAEGLEARLDRIILPSVNFENTTVEEAFEYYRQRSLELGCNEAGQLDLGGPDGPLAKRRIRAFRLRNVPFATVLRCTAAAIGATVTYSGQTITLRPGPPAADNRSEDRKKADALLAKAREDDLNRILVNSLIEDTPLEEAIESIAGLVTVRGIIDQSSAPPLRNILLLDPEGKLAGKRVAKLDLKKVPAKDALDAIAKACGATVRCEPYATVVEPAK